MKFVFDKKQRDNGCKRVFVVTKVNRYGDGSDKRDGVYNTQTKCVSLYSKFRIEFTTYRYVGRG